MTKTTRTATTMTMMRRVRFISTSGTQARTGLVRWQEYYHEARRLAAQVHEEAVEDEADAAGENQWSANGGHDGRNVDRERVAAVAAREVVNDSAEQNIEQATANLRVAVDRSGMGREANFRSSFAAVRALR